MKATITRLYRKPENVPVEVVAFIKQLSKDFPPRNIRLGETVEEAHRHAGISEQIELAIHHLNLKESQKGT
jgi:hypothetical protein